MRSKASQLTQRWMRALALLPCLMACLLMPLPSRAQTIDTVSEEQQRFDVDLEQHIGKTGAYTLRAGAVPFRLFLTLGDLNGAAIDIEKAKELGKRSKWMGDDGQDDTYTYEVLAPQTYDPAKPAGIVVFISAGDVGKLPSNYTDLLASRNLIAIGANNSGNSAHPITRQTLALYAVELIARRYEIDKDRIYITGSSGGGRSASNLMFYRPDVFTGGLPMIGTTLPSTRFVKAKNYPDDGYPLDAGTPGLTKMPGKNALRHSMKNCRYVILTGEKDFNRGQCETVAEFMQQNGWRYATFMVQPGLAHSDSSPEYFGKALSFLDAPLVDVAKEKLDDAEQDLERGRIEDALAGFQKALPHLELSEAEKEQALAERVKDQIENLNQQYVDMVKAVEDAIASKDHQTASEALRVLQRAWRDRLSREDLTNYRKQILEVRRGG